VANRNRGRRGRPRKRRPASASASQKASPGPRTPGAGQEPGAAEQKPKRSSSLAPREQRGPSRPRAAAQRSGSGLTGTLALGERPQAPWHPLPLSELLILVGAIGSVVAFLRGVSANGALLVAAIAAIAIGTIEVTLREHLSGYRSHTLLLVLLPIVAFHSAVVLVGSAFTRLPRVVNVALLPLDLLLGTILFKLLRARFLDARRERMFAAGR
jgi:hypothetical protein